jgi:hypothetical protein
MQREPFRTSDDVTEQSAVRHRADVVRVTFAPKHH